MTSTPAKLREMKEAVVDFLLNDISLTTPPSFLKKIAKEELSKTYAPEIVDEYLSVGLRSLTDEVVKERNARETDGRHCRFELHGSDGEKICGAKHSHGRAKRIHDFWDALRVLSPKDFEFFAGGLLKAFGSDQAWLTPDSHDQGLDAFGNIRVVDVTSLSLVSPFQVTCLVQAKHFVSTKVNVFDIREFAGSCVLAKCGVFATDHLKKYPQLEIKPFAPVASIFITSGEITVYARILAKNAGMIVLTPYDLVELVEPLIENGKRKRVHTLIEHVVKMGRNLPNAS